MSVYLIHFDKPLAHAKHYIGFADGDQHKIEKRLKRHKKNRGSALMAAVNAAGIDYQVVRIWLGWTKDQERELKNKKNACLLCPICVEEKKKVVREQRRIRRLKKKQLIEANSYDQSCGIFSKTRTVPCPINTIEY